MAGRTKDKREPIIFRKSILHSTTDTLQERIKADGTIEEMRVRFYPGQQKALQVEVVVEHKGQQAEYLYTSPATGERYLSGDDDYFIFPLTCEVEYDDFVKVRAVNTDATYDYDLAVDVLVDYYGGKNRVIGGVL